MSRFVEVNFVRREGVYRDEPQYGWLGGTYYEKVFAGYKAVPTGRGLLDFDKIVRVSYFPDQGLGTVWLQSGDYELVSESSYNELRDRLLELP